MSENTENPNGKSPRLYSLQDLQRVGHNPPDGLYTMNELGCMLLYLRVLAGDDGLCDECLSMGTGKKPCPHGNFMVDIGDAPILVWPRDQLRTDFALYTALDDDSEYWVTFDKTSNYDPATTPSTPASSVGRAEDESRCAMTYSEGFEPGNVAVVQSSTGSVSHSTTTQTEASSSAAALVAFASPFSTPSVASYETMIATSSSSSPSRARSCADTVSATRMTWLQQVWTEGPTATHSVDHGSRNAMQLATDLPGSLGLCGSILGDYPHFNTYAPSGKHQSMTISKTVNMFTNSSVGSASTSSGVSSKCGEFALTPDVFCEQVKDVVMGMQVQT